MKCDGTRAETRFRLSAKRTSPFKSAGASVQSTTGSRGVRIGGSNTGYTMFRGSVKNTGDSLHSPVTPSLPLPCVSVCHHISTGVYAEQGHAIAQAVSRQTQGSPRGIFGGKSGTEDRFGSEYFVFPSSVSCHQFSIFIHSSVTDICKLTVYSVVKITHVYNSVQCFPDLFGRGPPLALKITTDPHILSQVSI